MKTHIQVVVPDDYRNEVLSSAREFVCRVSRAHKTVKVIDIFFRPDVHKEV